MGYMRNHAIVVDSWSDEMIVAAHAEARECFAGVAQVSDLTAPNINGHRAFMVAPDGSKEGWAESDKGDVARETFKRYLRSKPYEDGSTSLRWVEVMFADDESRAAVVEHDAANMRVSEGTHS